MLAASLGVWQPLPASAQSAPAQSIVTVEQPDAERTKRELGQLLERYPPTLRSVLELDPTLLSNQPYLAPYPALVGFLNTHPEIAHNPSFYVGVPEPPQPPKDRASLALDMWREIYNGASVFAGFALAAGLLIWLIRTLVDYRRWNRLAKVQVDVHTKLLDRFTANDDLLAYIQSPAGAKFLESSPIKLDAAPKSVGAPLGRILWSLQGGLVLMSGGYGLHFISDRMRDDVSQPLRALGVLALALGVGFVASAIISYVISKRLGLIEPPPASRSELPNA
ncbi:MAG: hypothetical protein P4K98_13765 [Bryobacteraceae bacterium]|nr:hypothetical protein [Bryobacteraceae bacterium]